MTPEPVANSSRVSPKAKRLSFIEVTDVLNHGHASRRRIREHPY
jgi:hypothetical protein